MNEPKAVRMTTAVLQGGYDYSQMCRVRIEVTSTRHPGGHTMDRETTGKLEGIGDVLTEVHSALRELEIRLVNIRDRLGPDQNRVAAPAQGEDQPPTPISLAAKSVNIQQDSNRLHELASGIEVRL